MAISTRAVNASASYLFTGTSTHPWRWPQGPDDSWPGWLYWVAVLGIGQRPRVAAGSQEVRLNHPLQLLAAAHSVDAWNEVEFLRDKKWKARGEAVWIEGFQCTQATTLSTLKQQLRDQKEHSLEVRLSDKSLLLSCVTLVWSRNLSVTPFVHQS